MKEATDSGCEKRAASSDHKRTTSPVKEAYPELTYYLQADQPFDVTDDSLFLQEKQ